MGISEDPPQNDLKKHKEESTHVNSTVELLQMTSILLKLYCPLPYASTEDERFTENRKVLNWIEDWEVEVSGRVDLNASDRNKLIFSVKLLFDLKSMIIGFEQICTISFQLNPGFIIKSIFVNSDLVENIFCQIRGGNGQNNNSTYCQYGPTINSILFGQTCSTSKSITGKTSSFSFSNPKRIKY